MNAEFESTEPEVTEGSEPTENAEEVVENIDTEDEVNDIDKLTDEEFDKKFDDLESDDSEDDKDVSKENVPDKDLEALYAAQMNDADAKLDNPIIIKVKGKTYEVDSINELKNLAELGTSSTQKFQAIAEHRKTIDFMTDNGITKDDLDMIINHRGVEPVIRNDDSVAAEDVANEILNSPGAETFQEVAGMLPDDVKQEMASNAQMMAGFNHDVQSGLAQQIMPMAERFMNINGLSFMEAYVKAGDMIMKSGEQPQQQVKQTTNIADEKRKVLNSQPKTRQTNTSGLSKADIDKMSDEAFDKYFNDL